MEWGGELLLFNLRVAAACALERQSKLDKYMVAGLSSHLQCDASWHAQQQLSWEVYIPLLQAVGSEGLKGLLGRGALLRIHRLAPLDQVCNFLRALLWHPVSAQHDALWGNVGVRNHVISREAHHMGQSCIRPSVLA